MADRVWFDLPRRPRFSSIADSLHAGNLTGGISGDGPDFPSVGRAFRNIAHRRQRTNTAQVIFGGLCASRQRWQAGQGGDCHETVTDMTARKLALIVDICNSLRDEVATATSSGHEGDGAASGSVDCRRRRRALRRTIIKPKNIQLRYATPGKQLRCVTWLILWKRPFRSYDRTPGIPESFTSLVSPIYLTRPVPSGSSLDKSLNRSICRPGQIRDRPAAAAESRGIRGAPEQQRRGRFSAAADEASSIAATELALYQRPQMLTHEWVNGRRYLVDLARGRPTNPARIPVRPSGRWYYTQIYRMRNCKFRTKRHGGC